MKIWPRHETCACALVHYTLYIQCVCIYSAGQAFAQFNLFQCNKTHYGTKRKNIYYQNYCQRLKNDDSCE